MNRCWAVKVADAHPFTALLRDYKGKNVSVLGFKIEAAAMVNGTVQEHSGLAPVNCSSHVVGRSPVALATSVQAALYT